MSTARCLVMLLVAQLVVLAPAAAQEPFTDPGDQPSNLTLLNFFSEGWDQAWTHRHGRTPDMALLRVGTNFLERELRLDFVHTGLQHNSRFAATELANGLIAYGVNRRLMLAIVSNYQWNVPASASPVHGAGGGAVVRFQLIDTPDKSYAFQVRVSPPNSGIGQTQTSLSYALAGWQDLAALVPALDRVGLYYSIQYENLRGPDRAELRQNDLNYAVAVAKTWTDGRTPVLGDLTTFVEAVGTTDLDGVSASDTVFSVTPGVRFWFMPGNSLTFGVDVPLSRSPPFSVAYRATYILNFG